METIISELKCYACDEILADNELEYQDIFDGLCEQCYAEAMEAAYDEEDPLV